MALPADIPLAAGGEDTQVVPLLVKTLPVVLGATVCNADVVFPNSTLLAAKVVAPVPPDPTAKVALNPAAVPEVFWFSVGKSAATAIDNAPEVVVLLSMPVAKDEVPAL